MRKRKEPKRIPEDDKQTGSTKELPPGQLSPDTLRDQTVQFMIRHNRPLTRENYIRMAGLLEEEGDFAQLPEEFR